ncbi:hypothetical protein [Cognatishimia sp. MH4019]|uniref:hypothetical protein n=1 Tax=Cognatishimia sp. MH4019 TaxID=2854030 RepID=UPI001CD6C803|nr:hypothetical protein [Cognatishimia sp. MH4019]
MIFRAPFLILALAFSSPALACIPTEWVRHDGPVFRDRLFLGLYEAASDGHVFVTQDNQLAMIYSGDDSGQISIKLAFGSDWDEWEEWGVLLGPSKQSDAVPFKETAFYHRVSSTDHRLYFIGYSDETTYQSRLYMAQAPALTGPWKIMPEPVMDRGQTAGREVYLITSPSVVEHQGRLIMAWLGWNGFEDVTAVWSFSATSDLNGLAWENLRETAIPIGMEGQITARPDGGFVAVATQETDTGREGIFAFCADNPLGPWTALPGPLLSLAGDKWEVDEIIAPSITFDPQTDEPYLFYTAAEHTRGWRMMMAKPSN